MRPRSWGWFRLVLLLSSGLVLASCAPTGAPEGEAEPTQSVSMAEPISESISGPISVWLDVDPAIGLPDSEVDDGVMMLQAFHSPELELRGVSVVHGNTELENGLPVALDLVTRFGPPGLEVFEGAAVASQLGQSTPAVEAMARALEERPMTILAVGPVTNIGSLLQRYPELHERIESLVVVAGRRVGQSFQTGAPTNTPHADFNFERDVPAMRVLLESDVPLVMAPWEVSHWVWIRQSDLDRLAGMSEAGAFVAEACASWIARWKANLGVDGFNPFDTLAVAWLTHRNLIEHTEVAVWIEEGPDDRAPGTAKTKPYLLVDPAREGGRRAIYTYKPDASFQEILIGRIASPGEEESP